MTKFLLDTHILIWIFDASPRFKNAHWEHIAAADEVYFSPVSLFEIAILKTIGRLKTTPAPTIAEDKAFLSGFKKLPVETGVFDLYTAMPLHHKDPYDRLLIAQAKYHNLTLITADPWFEKYDIKVERV